jgi:hypothetical protein
MRSGTNSGVIGRCTGVSTDSLAWLGDGEGGSLAAILSMTGSGVTGRCALEFLFRTDRVLVRLLKEVGEVGELDVITNGDDDFGERGLSSFSMMESRFEVVMLMSGRVCVKPCVEATCSIDLKYCFFSLV